MGTVGGLLLVVQPGKSGIQLNRSASIIFVITILLSVESVLLTPIFRTYSVWMGLVWTRVGQIIGTVLLISCTHDKRRLWQAARAGGLRLWGTLIGEQSIRLLMSVLSAQVVAQGVPLAIAAAMGGLRPMFTLILAAFLLHERWPKQTLLPRLSGIACLLVSMILAVGGWEGVS
jgi:hypothetical protein